MIIHVHHALTNTIALISGINEGTKGLLYVIGAMGRVALAPRSRLFKPKPLARGQHAESGDIFAQAIVTVLKHA
eukprot:5217852-Pleurochrysis_carterae.AAC.6